MFYFIGRIIIVHIMFLTPSFATNLDLSSQPLYLGGNAEPNIMLTLDDSGSMQFETMPDEERYLASYMFPRVNNVYGGPVYNNYVPNFDDNNVHNFYRRSSDHNVIFYNPDIHYIPWSKADGSLMANADPQAAFFNPVLTTVGSLDLTSQQTDKACWFSHPSTLNLNSQGLMHWGSFCSETFHSYWPITYYNFNGGLETDRANYTRVQIGPSNTANSFISPSGIVRTRTEETQNFANWFQYYRSRILLSRAGIGRAFSQQQGKIRIGFSAINQGAATIDGVSSNSNFNQRR